MNICPNCGKELTGEKRHNKYCNNECQASFLQKEYIARWKRGEETGLKGEYQISNYVKKYLLDKANNKCEKCSWGEINPFTNNIPLQIHHIDSDWSHTVEDNLQVLCPNCHSLTENFGRRGGGREDRKKYYMTGVCVDCGAQIVNTSTRCHDCEQKRRKQENLNNTPISREDLKLRIRTETLSSIAKEFNISAGGLKRWMQRYNLPDTKKVINSYSDEEWEKI